MSRSLVAALLVAAACSPAPEPKASSSEPEPEPKPAPSREASEPEDAVVADASASDAAAEAAPKPVYEEPPPVVVRRHHVFTKLDARAGKRVTMTSLLTTASDEHPDLEVGTEATLQHKPKGKTEWADLAQVKVVSLKTKPGRFGTGEQLIAVEVQSEVAGTKGAYARGAKLRLQVDRPEQPAK